MAFIILIIVLTLAIMFSDTEISTANVAVIPINGVILTQHQDSLLGLNGVSSMDVVKNIEKADKNPRIEAIMIEINSPGGTAVASDEIAQALEKTNKTKVAWIREIGTSGAYWVASECDVIVANRMSITGSIGVISSYLDFSGLLNDYNITYQRLVAGKHKDIGSPFKELTDDERNLLQTQLDIIHDIFIDEVAQNRGLSKSKTREIATGAFYIGIQAKELDLVDILGDRNDAIAYIEKEIGAQVRLVDYKRKAGLIDVLSGVFNQGAFKIGQGFAQEIRNNRNSISLA